MNEATNIAKTTVNIVPRRPAINICKRSERPLVVNFGGVAIGMMKMICDATNTAAEIAAYIQGPVSFHGLTSNAAIAPINAQMTIR